MTESQQQKKPEKRFFYNIYFTVSNYTPSRLHYST
jgi:hypothetical protein